MIERPSKDAYTHAVIERISPAIRASFTPAQISAIEQALMGGRIMKRHPVELRLSIPLFFARYYFIFMAGRDRRIGTQRAEARRKSKISLSGVILLLILGSSPLILLIILVLYLLKSALGIDLFHDLHLKELFRL
ncbi:MAG: hypothetical protein JRL30_00625 [Deltaproteobacteria bacterium]|nr:hypothetical protein [Deltaproteobacteria bacterium]